MGIRTRACGIIESNGSIAMVKLHSPVINAPIWMPPGGGVHEGETIFEAVSRECFEEVRLKVQPIALFYIHELIKNGIHAIEYYVKCELISGSLTLGNDPERTEAPLLLEAKWVPLSSFPDNEMIRPEFLRNELSNDFFNWEECPRFIAHSSNQR